MIAALEIGFAFGFGFLFFAFADDMYSELMVLSKAIGKRATNVYGKISALVQCHGRVKQLS